MCLLCAALRAAKEEFSKSTGVRSETYVVGQAAHIRTIAVAEESSYHWLRKIHVGIQDGEWCLRSQKNLLSKVLTEKEREARQIKQSFTSTLLGSKAGLPRWNSVVRSTILQFIYENPANFKNGCADAEK